MKKLVLSLSLVVGVASAAHAQTSRFGVKAGIGLSRVTGNDASAGTFKSQLGLQAGAMADLSFSRRLAFHPELLFSQKGAKIDGGASYTSSGGTYVASQTGKVRLAYLDLPLLLRVQAAGVFFELGPQLGLLLSREFDKNTTTVVTYTGNPTSVVTTQNEASSSTDGARRLDVGYVLGVGYRLPQGLELGLRYNGGLAKLADGSSAPELHNSVFQLQVGYLFGTQ